MTTQDILELAGHRDVPPWVMKLVADCVAKEREECAKVCEEILNKQTNDPILYELGKNDVIHKCVEIIKSRGNND